LILGLARAHGAIEDHARQFLTHLLETNCTRVQSDILNRVQESRSRLEVEIRKLLHEIRRIAEQALTRARVARAEGASAVQAALVRLNGLEDEIRGTKAA
jgi:wyosine [tRNA(Phe)-imidazoG37] synthetase (radical SAM superfamily)